MVLRWCGKAGVRAATVRIGSRVAEGAFAWIVGGARVFCWLSASRSVKQKEAAAGAQVCAVMRLADGAIEWQLVISPALGVAI
jgi:hypothetical protein